MPAPRKSLDPFVRIDIKFALHDPRWIQLDDTSARIYIQLCALALDERRELLPARYDISSLAFILRRDQDVIGRALSCLSSMSDPLISMEHNRIRINGMQNRYDGRFKWKDNCEQLPTTANNCKQMQISAVEEEEDVEPLAVDVESIGECSPDVDELPADADNCVDELPPEPKTNQGNSTTKSTAGIAHTAQKVNSNGGNGKGHDTPKVEPVFPKPPPPCASEMHPLIRGRIQSLLEGAVTAFNASDSLWALAAKLESNNAVWLLAHVLEVEKIEYAVSRPAMLFSRIGPPKQSGPIQPSDPAQQRAKELLDKYERMILGIKKEDCGGSISSPASALQGMLEERSAARPP